MNKILIDKLAKENKGWKNQYSPLSLAVLLFLLFSVVIGTLYAYTWSGYRNNIFSQIQVIPFFCEFIIPFSLSIFMLYLAIAICTPGSFFQRNIVVAKSFLITSVLLLAINFSYPLLQESLPISMSGKREYCMYEIFFYGLFFQTVIYISIVSKRMVFSSMLSSISLTLAASLIPISLMSLACLYNPIHNIYLHWSPVIILLVIAYGSIKIIGYRK